MSNRLGEFFRGIKTSAEKIKASVEKAVRVVQGLDPDESLHYGGYTLTVGQKFGMRRLIDGTGQQYISEGKIVGFRKNDVVIERYSLSEGRYIFETSSIEEFVEMIKKGEIIGIYEDPNPAEGLDSVKYGEYTFKVGQTFKMWREIISTGETYLSSGEIVGFQKNGTIVVTKRYSFSNGRYIFEEPSIEEFVRMIESGQIIEIPKDPNPAEPIDEERVAREEDQRRINEIRRSIRDSIGAEAGVETPPTETSKIYDKTKGIEVYTTLDGEAIACYTSKYRRPNQEDRAVVGSKEIGGRVVNLMCAIDGVGGESHGEFAAQAFAESIQEIFNGLEDLSAPSDQNSLSEWQIIQDSLIIPAMNKAREKIEAKSLEAKKRGDSSYEKSSCVFTVVVIVGNEAYFYTVGDSIGTHFSLEDLTVKPYTTSVNSTISNGEERITAWVGLDKRMRDIKPLFYQTTLNRGDVVGVFTDGITDDFMKLGDRRTISRNMRDLLLREEPKIPTNIREFWLRLEEKLYSLLDGKREVTPSEKIARRILRYVKSLGRRAKEDNRTLMVYYHS